MNRILGKHPKRHDHRTLQLARYLPKLPEAPASIDHASRLPASIGMMGNDTYSDCTIAAFGHAIQSWSTYAERGMQTVADKDIESAYFAISPNDTGAAMLDALNYYRKTGVGGDKIEGFAEVPTGSVDYAKLCIQMFGSCYIGMSLPDVNTFGPWTTVTGAPNPNNGHAVVLIAYDDATQMFKVATWGEVWDMSYAWFKKYSDESYAMWNDLELIVASGKSPEGFDTTALQYDLAHIGDPIVTPTPTPTPAPTPSPTPTPTPTPTPPPAPTPAGWGVLHGNTLYTGFATDGDAAAWAVGKFNSLFTIVPTKPH